MNAAKVGPKEQEVRELKLARHHEMMLEDGAPEALLRRPGERRAPVAAQALAEAEERATKPLSPEERVIREEADRRWRNWSVDPKNPKERTRPRIATFVKRVRTERKKAAKAAAKATALKVMPVKGSISVGDKVTTRSGTGKVVAVLGLTQAPATPANKQETTMAKKSKTTKAKKSTASTSRKALRAQAQKAGTVKIPVRSKDGTAKTGPKEVRPGSKTEAVARLLLQPEGTTTADILKATGWPTVSVPQQAKAAGLSLRKEKTKGEPTRYFGAAA